MDQSERNKMHKASKEAAVFLLTHDQRLNSVSRIELQPDSACKSGDVRDILIYTKDHGVVGISAKNRHNDLKHSRLSDTIDFGKLWYSKPCSNQYWSSVNPVFDDLRLKQQTGTRWKNVKDKKEGYYQQGHRFSNTPFSGKSPAKLMSFNA